MLPLDLIFTMIDEISCECVRERGGGFYLMLKADIRTVGKYVEQNRRRGTFWAVDYFRRKLARKQILTKAFEGTVWD